MAKDWTYHVWLLQQTVTSMLAQTAADVQVIVGCHDVPEGELRSHPRVHFECVSIDLPVRTIDMSVDKVMKHSVAARRAIAAGATHVIFNDADDLVSNRVGKVSLAEPSCNGWYSATQRFFVYGGTVSRLISIPQPRSGPFVMVRSDLLQFNSEPFSGAWVDIVVGRDEPAAGRGEHEYLELLARHRQPVCTLAAVGHNHYLTLMERLSRPLRPLPFPANLVINHPDSMSTAGGPYGYQPLSKLGYAKRSVRWLPTIRIVTPAMRREFMIPPKSAIPTQFRGGASVFWR